MEKSRETQELEANFKKMDAFLAEVAEFPEFLVRDMAEIVGVATGVKQVAMDMFLPTELIKADLEEFRRLLHALGIRVVFERRALGGNDPMNFGEYYYLAKTHDEALIAQTLFHRLWNGDRLTDWEIANLLGYPQTAIEYFLKRNPENDTEVDKARMERNRFYVHSPEHEDEEFKSYEAKIYETIRLFCPETWKAICAEKGKRLE